jgi:hypothetical protein
MATIRVSNIEAKADVSSPTVDEKVKVTSSDGRVLVHIDGKSVGVTSIGINTTANTFTINNNNITFLGGVVASGISTFATVRATSIVGVSTVGVTTAYVGSINDGPIAGARNKIINGAMEISQRGTTFAAMADQSYNLDRWVWNQVGAMVVTISQSTDVPNNTFQNSHKVDVTTADTSIVSADVAFTQHRIEGYNVRDLIGQTFTLSFWVKSPKIGVHCVAFRNTGPDRSYVMEYMVSSANTWEYKTLTVTGGLITAGTWDWTNGIGLRIGFTLTSGSTFHTTPGSWNTGNFYATSNQVNVMDNTANDFFLTGVQLEVGSVATPFERRSYGQELALCQRYFYRQDNYMGQAAPFDNEASGAVGQSSGTANVYRAVCRHPVEMRGTPTVTFANIELWDGGVQRAVTTINNNNSSKYTRSVDWNMNGNMTALGRPAFEFIRPSGFIACSSEI